MNAFVWRGIPEIPGTHWAGYYGGWRVGDREEVDLIGWPMTIAEGMGSWATQTRSEKRKP